MNISENTKEHLAAIKAYCKSHADTISVAESVTSGCVQLLLSNGEGAEEFFQGGITTYNTPQKTRHLNIEPLFAQSCNAVDPAIAKDLALQVCRMFCSSIGLATTGYAAPYPERGIDVPFAFLSIAHRGTIIYSEKVFAQSREYGLGVQLEFAEVLLRQLAQLLGKKSD